MQVVGLEWDKRWYPSHSMSLFATATLQRALEIEFLPRNIPADLT
jgi:hypothetical protein